MTKSHESDNNSSNFKHVCIIAVFLLVKLLYLLIHSLDYLFRPIQTLTVLTDLIDLVAVSSSITYCLLNLPLKPIPSQHSLTANHDLHTLAANCDLHSLAVNCSLHSFSIS